MKKHEYKWRRDYACNVKYPADDEDEMRNQEILKRMRRIIVGCIAGDAYQSRFSLKIPKKCETSDGLS